MNLDMEEPNDVSDAGMVGMDDDMVFPRTSVTATRA